MRVPQQPNVYQIGCLERRVTLYSQQVRALNLVYALCTLKRLGTGNRVGIVGAGAAGITAAVALTKQGVEVTLLERLDEVIPLQSGNLTRWLHPHIYDWPADDWQNPEAGLPLLNWSAGYADTVAAGLREEFYRHVREADKLYSIYTSVKNVRLHEQRLEWNSAGGNFHSERFDMVVLAVGFGLEHSCLAPVLSYWRNDDLAQFELDAERGIRSYLISGCGDGGLVDLLRLRIRNFRHDRMLEPAIFTMIGKVLAWVHDQ